MVYVEKFKLDTLDNGIRVVTEEVDFVKSVAVGVWIRAGSIDENKEINGVAHLIEHLLFKGTKKRSSFQIAYDIESIGGGINAFTSKDNTCYYVRIISDHIERAFEVLSDLVCNYDINGRKLKSEKNIVYEEIKESEDDPFELVNDLFQSCLFPEHPYGMPVQGTLESVKNIDLQDIFRFLEANYSSDRVIISVAGNLEHDRIVDISQKYFGKLGKSDYKRQIEPVVFPKEKRFVFRKDIAQTHVIIGRRTFPINDERRYVLNLLNVILSGGMSSRLFQNIREKFGYVYSINSFVDFFDTQGIFGIYAGVNSSKMERVIELIYSELRKVAKGEIKESEIAKAKEQLKGSIVISMENMSTRMNRLAKMLIYEGKLYSVDEILKKVSKVTKDSVIELAKFLYNEGMFVETILTN